MSSTSGSNEMRWSDGVVVVKLERSLRWRWRRWRRWWLFRWDLLGECEINRRRSKATVTYIMTESLPICGGGDSGGVFYVILMG
ncbi:hypothetical protein HanIR_Chr04g0157381 [Helianthus annuus]|nr:hypothetical protein HanIR_Chr04g0157381 [Helianthus annuus]